MAEAVAHTEELSCVTTQTVLVDEYRLIWGDADGVAAPVDYYRAVIKNGQAALCLSGGGIRSAAVGLGTMQALSRGGLLTGFHYLSSVSGGGYINGWLQRWIHSADGDATAVMRRLAGLPAPPPPPGAPQEDDPEDLDRVEPKEVKHLRENSNFITPRVGIGSNDTWTAIAISVRNILINWLMFAPLILLVALFPNLFLDLLEAVRSVVQESGSRLPLVVMLVAEALLIAWATKSTVRLLPSYRSPNLSDALRTRARSAGGDNILFRRIVLPLLLWSLFAALTLSAELLGEAPVRIIHLPIVTWETGVDLALFSLAGMIVGLVIGWAGLDPDHARTFRRDWAIWPVSFVVTTSWIALGAILFASVMPSAHAWRPVVLAVFGPFWLLTSTLVGAVVFAAFRFPEGPRIRPDGDREWLGRLSATKLKPMLFWALLAPSVLLLNRLSGFNMTADGTLPLTSLMTLLFGATAAAGGHSRNTAAAQTQSGRGVAGAAMKVGRSLARFLPLDAIVSLATLLFIIALLVLFGRLEFGLAERASGWLTDLFAWTTWNEPGWVDPAVAAHILLLGVLILLIMLFGRLISVNDFSLHGFYRNRLARAFLGAARPWRRQDPFTGFDSRDNVRLHQLAPKDGAGRAILYPVINVALNVTATENLAWQERKAMPFVFTPLYSGSRMLAGGDNPARRTGAYVRSRDYAGREPDFGMREKLEAQLEQQMKTTAQSPAAEPKTEAQLREEIEAKLALDDRGVTLATAMAISGAAATPNMGYYSSPATAFLMTLFNVRLGAWLPNPALAGDPRKEKGKVDVTRSSPTNSITAILQELRGATHDRGPDVYLSDGGHFENLGLYEMIQRRCRYIVVSDAGADPDFALKDLGNAVRKVKIDLDVDIEFAEMRLSRRGEKFEPPPQLPWALGRITYPETHMVRKGRNQVEENLEGWVLYIKPSFFGPNLPVDVVAYGRGSAAFPHESTIDQFFSESQFESYRRLADHFVDGLMEGARAHVRRYDISIEDLFAYLRHEVAGRTNAAPAPEAERRCCCRKS